MSTRQAMMTSRKGKNNLSGKNYEDPFKYDY
jgi:hypothetical protein